MTSDERDEAERLAREKFPADDSHVSEQLERDCFIEGYAAGRESLRSDEEQLEDQVHYYDVTLEFERKRSAKMIEALEKFKKRCAIAPVDGFTSREIYVFLETTVDEYNEASRDDDMP